MCARRRTSPSSLEDWTQLAVRYLARLDRTVAQVERFLTGKGATSAQIKRVIGRLSGLHYLNDRAYAARWLESRLSSRPVGRERLKAELQAKGIPEIVVDGAILDALQGVDEASLARRALRIRQRRGRPLTRLQTVRLLRQWGFDEETIDCMMNTRSGREDTDA